MPTGRAEGAKGGKFVVPLDKIASIKRANKKAFSDILFNKTGVLLNGDVVVETDAVIEVNANSITLGVGNTDASVTNGQVRITAIEVVYN